MKSAKVLFTALAFMIFTSAYSQQINRADICQSIPGLSTEQQQKIDRLGLTHQKKMDDLRTQFRSESNAQSAALLKTQMNNEMQSHNRNISAMLTPEQLTWYDQTCNANGNGSYNTRPANGRGLGRGQGVGRGQSIGRGAGYGRSVAYKNGTGYGRGTGPGRGRNRCVYW